VRDEHEDMLATLKELPHPIQGTIHCFSGNWEQAEQYLSFGLHLGFTGIITYPPRKTNPEATTQILDVIKRMPSERIVVETDAPFLAAQAYRGTRAEPWMVAEVVKKIAEARGMTYEEVEKISFANSLQLFWKVKV
jgi:TatD DNase family protein